MANRLPDGVCLGPYAWGESWTDPLSGRFTTPAVTRELARLIEDDTL